MSEITLCAAIQNLRGELLEAMRASPGEELQFRLGPIEMELEVEAKRDTTAKGGIKWWLIEGGAETKRGTSSTHRIKLVLEPVTANGGRPNVNDNAARPD